jgi:hypothetical protein
MKRNHFFGFFAAVVSLSFFSCTSTKESEFLKIEDSQTPPPLLTELPVIEYSGIGIKYEVESMLLNQFMVFQDTDASGNFAARLLTEASTAKLKVKFAAGTYECLLREKATDLDHSAFYVYLDNIPYRVYPSNPPLGTWEMTTRAPIYFTIDEPRTILITIQANCDTKTGDTGMNLDYIQFVKRR